MMLRAATRLAMLLLLAGFVTACGVRGSLDAPEAAKATGTNASPEAADPGKGSAADQKEHRPFILDGLLR